MRSKVENDAGTCPSSQSSLALKPRFPNSSNVSALCTTQAFSVQQIPCSSTPTQTKTQSPLPPALLLPQHLVWRHMPPSLYDVICHAVYEHVFLYKHLSPTQLESSLFCWCPAQSLFIGMKSTSAGWMNELWECFRHHTGVGIITLFSSIISEEQPASIYTDL